MLLAQRTGARTRRARPARERRTISPSGFLWIAGDGVDGETRHDARLRERHYPGTFTGLPVTDLLNLGWLLTHSPRRCRALPESIYLPAVEARTAFSRWNTASAGLMAATRGCWTPVSRGYEPDGSFAGYVGSAIDITERREMELSLVDNQAEAATLVPAEPGSRGPPDPRAGSRAQARRARPARRPEPATRRRGDHAERTAGARLRTPPPSPRLEPTVRVAPGDARPPWPRPFRILSHDLHPGVLKHAGLAAVADAPTVKKRQRYPDLP